MRVFVARTRGEPLRLATLGILFVATMVAAAMLPKQVRAALDARSTSGPGVESPLGAAPDPWWTPTAESDVLQQGPSGGHRNAAHTACRRHCGSRGDAASAR